MMRLVARHGNRPTGPNWRRRRSQRIKPFTRKLGLAIAPWRWQNTPVFVRRPWIIVGGSPGASRGPGICLTRPINMAVAIASIASARCAVKVAEDTPWVAFVPRVAPWEARTKQSAAALSATTAGRNITGHAAALNAGKPAEQPWFRGSRFTNLYASITNIYAGLRSDVLSYCGVGKAFGVDLCWRNHLLHAA